jgi:hypothetical protein
MIESKQTDAVLGKRSKWSDLYKGVQGTTFYEV